MGLLIDIIYIRTSTELQNPQNQLKDCESIAPAGAVIYEEKQSAWKDHVNARPIFKEIQDLIKNRQVASFTVWDLDRIYRKRTLTVEFMQLCNHFNVVVKSYRQTWLSEIEKIPSPWNEIVHNQLIQIFGWIAEEESNKKSERVKIAFENHKGKDWGRPKVDVNYFQVHNLKNQGLSIRAIAAELQVSKSVIERVLKTYPKNSYTVYKENQDFELSQNGTIKGQGFKCPICNSLNIADCKGGTNLNPNPDIDLICQDCLCEFSNKVVSKLDQEICDLCDSESEFISDVGNYAYCRLHAEKNGVFDSERNYRPINKCVKEVQNVQD